LLPISQNIDATNSSKLPWWTWIAALIIIHIGTEISLLFKFQQGVVDYYLPTSLSLLLINWWGPVRVLSALYVNAVLSTYLWGIPADRWPQWFIYAIPETVFTFLSWYLFRKLFNGKYWLPDIKNTLLFLVFAILIPLVPELFLLQGLHIMFGDQTMGTFWSYIARNWLGEFTACFGLALPGLYYLTPFMHKAGLLLQPPDNIPRPKLMSKAQLVELVLIFFTLFALVFIIQFEKYWYVYGLFSLYTAIRFGFGPAIITNYYIFLITYILPKLLKSLGVEQFYEYPDVTNIFLGASLLFVFAAITGRVISDLRIAEASLQKKNQELDLTNKELDRFVYSVSHDLTAPLKSILGLVNISRMSNEIQEQLVYLNRIETSVKRLEFFIGEILDYSRNKRKQIITERIILKEVCQEIIENLRYLEGFHKVSIDYAALQNSDIFQDKMRLKIILNNLITNAIKFQKRIPDHKPFIKISSRRRGTMILIDIEDNGEGIREEYQGRVFDMFFRATENEKGSGLGLYIAHEAALRIDGNIYVKSQYGKGSVFTVELINLKDN
jgi:signal transduction histidine kinase